MTYKLQHAREMLDHYAELAEDELQAERDRLDAATAVMWALAEAAHASGAIPDDRFERFECLALEEGLAEPPCRPSPIMDMHDATISGFLGSECATEGCDTPSAVRFIRGGIGSDYCLPCYRKVQALTTKGEASS